MPPQPEHGSIITLAGIEFRVEVVSATYTKLIRVTDKLWMLRHCETVGSYHFDCTRPTDYTPLNRGRKLYGTERCDCT